MIEIIIEKLYVREVSLEGIYLQMTAFDAAIVILIIIVVILYIKKHTSVSKNFRSR
ncbi:hypothetical protein [Methanosarcina vacuolata]|uniref:hypothetical protein n=1 Tax=Methanosarcina vacuolata TaxID=2215 RepID=UPI0012F62D1D|nr:hypothetical protein [Methanosarcina vacuolata]